MPISKGDKMKTQFLPLDFDSCIETTHHLFDVQYKRAAALEFEVVETNDSKTYIGVYERDVHGVKQYLTMIERHYKQKAESETFREEHYWNSKMEAHCDLRDWKELAFEDSW